MDRVARNSISRKIDFRNIFHGVWAHVRPIMDEWMDVLKIEQFGPTANHVIPSQKFEKHVSFIELQ